MPLLAIRNQSISMSPIIEEADSSCAPLDHCTLFKTGDQMRVQMRQTPCADDLMCSGGFDFGSNLLTNPDFTGSAAGWTLGTGWSYSSNTIVHSGAAGSAIQSVSGLVAGQLYQCTIEVTALGSDLFVSLALGVSEQITSTGTHVFNLIAGGTGSNLIISNSNAFTATVTKCELRLLACWEYTSTWTIDTDNDTACHTPGTAGYLRASIYSTLTSSDYLNVTFSIFGMSAGTITVKAGGNQLAVITESGTYSLWGTLGGTDSRLTFEVDGPFDGCISPGVSHRYLSIAEVSTAARLIDSNNDVVTIVDPLAEIIEDRIIYYLDTTLLADDCYTLSILDPCGDVDGVTEINSDVPLSTSGSWTIVEDIGTGPGVTTTVVSGGKMTQSKAANALGVSAVMNTYLWPTGQQYYVVDIEFTTGTIQSSTEVALYLPNGSATIYYPLKQNVLSNTTYSLNKIVGVLNQNPSTIGTAGNIYNKFGIGLYCTDAGGTTNEISSFSIRIKQYDPANQPYISNCLSVRANTGNAKLIIGLSDSDRSHGFIFTSNFPQLENRLQLSFTNPHHTNKNGGYNYSNGRKKKTYSANDKAWDLTYHKVDENKHDNIQAIMSMDHFYIGELTDNEEYYWEDKSYDPDWPKKGNTGLAESTVEVSRIDQGTYK